MRLTHLALVVRDPAASARFYEEVLQLTARTRVVDGGLLLACTDGMVLALLQGEPPDVGDVHFGCVVASADEVRRQRARFAELGVTETEWLDGPGYTSVKVLDPDGYVVEVSWEVQ